MKLSNLQDGKTALITNLYVYAASAMDDGAVVLADTGTATTNVGVTVTTSTSSTIANDFCGVTNVSSSFATASQENLSPNSHAFRVDTDGIPDRGIATGGDFLPVIVSPGAIYLASYSVTTGAATASQNMFGFTASNTTNLVNSNIMGSQNNVGSWIFTLATVSAGTATFSGQLRQCTISAATTSQTLATALQVSADTEAVLTMSPFSKSCALTTGGSELVSREPTAAVNTAMRNDGAQCFAIDNVIKHDSSGGYKRLRQHVDDGLDGITGATLYSEIVFCDNYFTNT